jgi:FMN phosphatase YigB (HAD superfamily)
MKPSPQIVFLLDVDDTLIDNDRFEIDLGARIESAFGVKGRDRYWKIYETLRGELDYADYLGALQRFRRDTNDAVQVPLISAFLLGYPFAQRLYAGALDTLARLGALGVVVLLSDGDVVFQPHKIRRSGLWDAVNGRVLIYVHKERMLADIERRYPARHYTMVDDKPRVLTAMKNQLGKRLTTVFVRQGHYAHDHSDAPADLTLDRIADLAQYDLTALRDAAQENL